MKTIFSILPDKAAIEIRQVLQPNIILDNLNKFPDLNVTAKKELWIPIHLKLFDLIYLLVVDQTAVAARRNGDWLLSGLSHLE
jgi:hypothetical protein